MFKANTSLTLPEVSESLGLENPVFDVLAVMRGGMGEVVRLRSRESGNEYALKRVIPSQTLAADGRQRFLREAEVWREASTCNGVVEAHAIIEIDGALGVIAEWMEGGSLRSTMDRLSWSERIACALRMTRALRWVHTKLGFVHRDIKPENILLDQEHRAFIGDWGLAKPGSSTGLPATHPLQTRGGMGTPAYMAPEQFIDAKSVDHRADIYSLGCILFEFQHGLPPAKATPNRPMVHSAPAAGFRESELAKIISRCLQEKASRRCSDYAEIESVLEIAAARLAVPDEQVRVGMRGLRHPLSSASARLASTADRSTVRGRGVVIVELAEIRDHLEEAEALMALGKRSEALRLLEPLHIPELLEKTAPWCHAHAIAAACADCMQQDPGRIDEALDLLASLEKARDKPAAFFVNASFANLQAGHWGEALRIARAGLEQYPDDVGLLGNSTVALVSQGMLDEARGSAARRLELRRDTRALEEMSAVLGAQRDRLRPFDLPRAVALAHRQSALIIEGLDLSPSDAPLRIAKADLLRFAHASGTACEAYDALVKDGSVHSHVRQLALARQAQIFGETMEYSAALRAVERTVESLRLETALQIALEAKWRLLAENVMFGRVNDQGLPIVVREIAEFFLQEQGGRYQRPVMAARILRVMGRDEEVEQALREAIAKDADRQAAQSELAIHLAGLGRTEEALQVAQQLISGELWCPQHSGEHSRRQ